MGTFNCDCELEKSTGCPLERSSDRPLRDHVTPYLELVMCQPAGKQHIDSGSSRFLSYS